MSEKIIKENVSRDSEELSESSYESADTSKPAEDVSIVWVHTILRTYRWNESA